MRSIFGFMDECIRIANHDRQPASIFPAIPTGPSWAWTISLAPIWPSKASSESVLLTERLVEEGQRRLPRKLGRDHAWRRRGSVIADPRQYELNLEDEIS
jgi:hypothetical protein